MSYLRLCSGDYINFLDTKSLFNIMRTNHENFDTVKHILECMFDNYNINEDKIKFGFKLHSRNIKLFAEEKYKQLFYDKNFLIYMNLYEQYEAAKLTELYAKNGKDLTISQAIQDNVLTQQLLSKNLNQISIDNLNNIPRKYKTSQFYTQLLINEPVQNYSNIYNDMPKEMITDDFIINLYKKSLYTPAPTQYLTKKLCSKL
jgi:hypothetical protein